MNEEQMREVEEEKLALIELKKDPTQKAMYEMRSKILKDKVSALNEAERKGEERGEKKGRKEEKLEIALKSLSLLDNETIAVLTGLDIQEIESLRHQNK